MSLHASSQWQGKAELRYAVQGGVTQPTHRFTQAPLRLQRAFHPEPGRPHVCHSVLIHTAGGMVGGDSLSLDLALAPCSHVLLTQAAANKVYRSPEVFSAQTVNISLAPGSCLEWFPSEMICFDGSHFQQTISVDLQPGAVWAGWDITRFGRTARGERFSAGHWRSHIDVHDSQGPLWISRQQLTGGSSLIDSVYGLAGQAVSASFFVLGHPVSSQEVQELRGLCPPNPQEEVGITRLQRGLLGCYRGPSSRRARQWFMALWGHLRPAYRGLPAHAPRVWT